MTNSVCAKAKAYDILTGALARAFVKSINEGSGSEFDRGCFDTLKRVMLVVKELDEQLIKEVKSDEGHRDPNH